MQQMFQDSKNEKEENHRFLDYVDAQEIENEQDYHQLLPNLK